METFVSIPVQTSLFTDLVAFLRGKNDPRDPVRIVTEAIDYWMENASEKPELLAKSDARGYQWKNLFLPSGTQVRMPYKGAYSYAKVEGDEILYEGMSVTPGSLANMIAGTSRNAWRDLWILRPTDHEWRLANDCRQEVAELGDRLLSRLEKT